MKTIGYILVLCLSWPFFVLGQLSESATLESNSKLQLIKSDYNEMSPMLSADGLKLFFIRKGHPRNMGNDDLGDLWLSQRNDIADPWGPAVNLGGPINSLREDRPLGLDALGHTVYMAKQSVLPISKDGRLWVERYNELIPLITEEVVWISPLGDLALLSRNTSGGFGGYDLYLQQKLPGGTWSLPVNLGPEINSSGDERSGFIAADERRIYFSSNGKNGLGGTDWWTSERSDLSWNNWQTTQNLGTTVNTPFEDIHLSSTADGSFAISSQLIQGKFELREVFIPENLRPGPSQLIKGRVSGLNYSGIHLEYTCTGDRSYSGELWVPTSGEYALVVPVESVVHLEAKAQGFLGQSALIMDTDPSAIIDKPQGNILASLADEPTYAERDASISSLRLRLDKLNEERITLRAERDDYLEKLRAKTSTQEVSLRTDPEIEALRHRFENYLYAEQRDTIPNRQVQARGVPQSYDYNSKKQELDEMKARFRRHFEAEKRERQLAGEDEEYLWSEPMSFNQIKAAVEKELRAEMTPEIGRKMLDEWESDRSPNQQIETAAIKQQIEQSFWVPNRPSESQHYLPDDLRKELRENMRPAIAAELEQRLRQDIQQAADTDLALRQREAEISQLERQIDNEVLQQIQTEELTEGPAPSSYDYTSGEQEWMRKAAPSPIKPLGLTATQKDLRLIPKRSGSSIILSGILFSPNSDYFKPASMPELKRLVQFLTDNPELKVEIGGHTNALLSHAFALQLSRNRATAVVDYLVENGIAKERLKAKAYGKTSPIADNDSPQGRQKNQRIELTIL